MGILFNLTYTFFALCIFVFLCVILTNLFLKSYKPQNTLIIIGGILLVFIINFVLAYGSMQSAMVKIRSVNTAPESSENLELQDEAPENLPDVF